MKRKGSDRIGSDRIGSEKKTEYRIERNTNIIYRMMVLLVMVEHCIKR